MTRSQVAEWLVAKATEQPAPSYVPSELGPCLLAPQKPSHTGYVVVKVDGSDAMAHRLVYDELVESIPDGMLVCHHCDRPSCLSPPHLFPGTDADNVRDAMSKGRRQGRPRATTPVQRRVIRHLHTARGVSRADLAQRFGVSYTTIHRIFTPRARS